jgi:hypothetical protein
MYYMMVDECEAVGGMNIGRGNRSTRKKYLPQYDIADRIWDPSILLSNGYREGFGRG